MNGDLDTLLPIIASLAYFVAAVLFILGIKRMASPVTARRGIVQAGWGMVIATVATFGITREHNFLLILTALLVGIIPAWLSGKRVAMTSMPQMVALYNGMGGGAAAAIAAVELLRESATHSTIPLIVTIVGAFLIDFTNGVTIMVYLNLLK